MSDLKAAAAAASKPIRRYVTQPWFDFCMAFYRKLFEFVHFPANIVLMPVERCDDYLPASMPQTQLSSFLMP